MHPRSAIWSVTILHRSLLAMLPANLPCISKCIRNGNKPLFRCKRLSYCMVAIPACTTWLHVALDS